MNVLRDVTVRTCVSALFLASALQAQSTSLSEYPRTFALTVENDAFGSRTDEAYTQGLRFSWEVAHWPRTESFYRVFPYLSGAFLIPDTMRLRPPRAECDAKPRPCGAIRFGLGQTMYTPADLTTPQSDPNERPYAGLLFISAAFIESFTKQVITTEVQLGVTGHPAGARETQSLAHWINAWENTRPQGWDNQLKAAPMASLRSSISTKMMEYCVNDCDGSRSELRLFDVSPEGEVMLGWPITRFSAGATVRLGFGFPNAPGLNRIPETIMQVILTQSMREMTNPEGDWKQCLNQLAQHAARHAWFDVFFNVADRYVARNTLITGSAWDDGPGGWSSLKRISREPHVNEYAGGLAIGIEGLVLSYQRVARSAEYLPHAGPHYYGSVTISLASTGHYSH